jgi:transcriptional regulator with XRE-family HTH domain
MPAKNPDAIDVYVGGRVRMRRMILKMSQDNLGKQIGITFQQVQKYEKGTNRIGASRLQKIASVLGVAPSFFFRQEGTEPVSTGGTGSFQGLNDVSQFLHSREGLALNEAFLKISDPKIRQKVVALVKVMAGPDNPLLVIDEVLTTTQTAPSS